MNTTKSLTLLIYIDLSIHRYNNLNQRQSKKKRRRGIRQRELAKRLKLTPPAVIWEPGLNIQGSQGAPSPKSKLKKLHPLCELMELLTKPLEKVCIEPLLRRSITMLAHAYLVDMSRKWRP